MTDKRQRTMTEATFDVHIHTLVQQPPTVGCVRIASPDTAVPLPKDNMVSLVILADASGSMQTGGRIENLRSGIMRLGELSNQFASMQVELTIIQFNEVAGIVWGPAPMPSMEKLRTLCSDIKPKGGTNISHAIEVGLNITEQRAFVGKSVHMVLFTDGVDTSSLDTMLENGTLPYLDQLKNQKRLTLHCVGICADADAMLLDRIVRAACRGTFQCIKDVDISRLIGSMWGLMMEMVDQNIRLVVETTDSDGSVSAVVSRDVILRVCSPPMPLVIGFKVLPTTTMIRARMLIDERCLDARLSLPRTAGAAFDMVCAQEAVNLLQAELSEKIVVLLRAGNPSDAMVEVGITRETIQKLLEKVESEEQRAEFSAIVDVVMQELNASEANLLRAINDFEEGREIELREMSRCATVRNSGVSITADSRTLSVLQRELSA
jgi:hypothetical protein